MKKEKKAQYLSIRQLVKVNKTLKSKKKDKILHILKLSDLKVWTDLPNIPFQTKTDKIKEVIILMAYLGLRVYEAINFDWTSAIPVRNSLKFKVIGKANNKERFVFNVFHHDYIKTKTLLIKHNKIPSIDYPITRFGVRDYIHRLAKKLHWVWIPNPHDFRRAFASALLYEKNVNKLALQQILGHAFFSTTERYLRKDPRTLESLLDEFL
ncbi:MAG TPA: site-specific integrase [Mycoplasmatales bacterium]|nr:site-specific integrase [Mycoplasmatales bacterium]